MHRLKTHSLKPETEDAVLSALSHEYPAARLHRQVFLYFLVGTIGTAADFAVMNLMLYAAHMPLIFANSLGISAGLLVGYFTNKKWVFSHAKPTTKRHFAYFVIITAIGLYGVQNGVVYFLSVYPLLQNSAAGIIQSLFHHIPLGSVRTNISKLIASLVAGVFDFTLYRKFVFLYHPKRSSRHA